MTSLPPFTTAAAAVTICMGVTLVVWPNAELESSTIPISDSFTYSESASPGRSIPVFSVKPKASKYLLNFSTPRSWPIFINAGLHERIIASVRFDTPWPPTFQHLIFVPATSAMPEHSNVLSSDTTSSSSAEAQVNILNTEPGIYSSLTALFCHCFPHISCFLASISSSVFLSADILASVSLSLSK